MRILGLLAEPGRLLFSTKAFPFSGSNTTPDLMNKRFISWFFICLALCSLSVQAATKYWDINGATAGSGQGTGTGTWDTTTANWSTDPAGTVATGTFVNSTDGVVFSAGTDGTAAWTINLNATRTAAGMTVEEG